MYNQCFGAGPSSSAKHTVTSPSTECHDELRNYRWANGLVTKDSFGKTLESNDDYNSIQLNQVASLARKTKSEVVLHEFKEWVKSFKFTSSSERWIKVHIDSALVSVRRPIEQQEFNDIEEFLKGYWKMSVIFHRESIQNSAEEYLVPWFASILKSVKQHKIKQGSIPKLTDRDIQEIFEIAVRPLKLISNLGHRKNRIYIHNAVKFTKNYLGDELCENNEQSYCSSSRGIGSSRLHDKRRRKKDRKRLETKDEKFEEKVAASSAHPLLLKALTDFRKAIHEPELSKTSDIMPCSIKLTNETDSVFSQRFEALFDVDEIMNSVADVSDDCSYSGVVLQKFLGRGNGLNPNMLVPGKPDCPYFMDLTDPDTFAVFQSEFVEAASSLFAKRRKSEEVD